MSHNQNIGKYGEDLACDYLRKKGYKIIARNRHFSHCEVDIITNIRDITVFVEVKTRIDSADMDAESAINRTKIKNLKYAIMNYAYTEKLCIDDINLDVLTVNINKAKKIAKISHYQEII